MENIKRLQEVLSLETTGFLDELTIAGIKNFQMRAGLPPNGKIDEDTLNKLEALTSFKKSEEDDTDFGTYNEENDSPMDEMLSPFSTDMFEVSGPYIKYHMNAEQYFAADETKTCIFLHHTAGWNNPYSTIKDWGSDTRGKIGTEFVIGGINIKSNDTKFNGKTLQAFPGGSYAYHLGGKVPMSLTKRSIGIELCNFGYLLEKNGSFYTYTGANVPDKYITELDTPFRGHKYYHSYTNEQIESLRKLIVYLSHKYNINISSGIKEDLQFSYDKHAAFEYKESIVNGYDYEGIFTHTNVRKDKFDLFPQTEMVQMLESLN